MAKAVKVRRSEYLKRYREIITVLLKYGFEDVVSRTPFNRRSPFWARFFPQREGKSVLAYSRYERMRLVAEELGPTFIKFGQILSNRSDLVPEELLWEMEKLQDKVPPFSSDEVKIVLEREYGSDVHNIFSDIDLVPLASASMAQVHKAVLSNGKLVVLKIQRPDIEKLIAADVRIMRDLAGIIERNFPDLAALQPLELVRTFEKSLLKELDFNLEASTMERFKEQFEDTAEEIELFVPEVFRELTTERVLCMEYVDGVKISNREALMKMNVDLPELARRGVDIYFRQVFIYGLFHADPHPGNLFILPDGRMCILDFGMMGQLMPEDQEVLGDLLYFISQRDIRRLGVTLQRLARSSKVLDPREFEFALRELVDEYFTLSLSELQISEIIRQLQQLLIRFKIEIPSNFHLLLRALVILEGVGLYLDPKFQIMDEMEPYARQIVTRKYKPGKLLKNTVRAMEDLATFAVDLPADLKDLMDKVKAGNLHIEFEHRGLNPFYNMLDIISSRVSFAIVVAALIVGSALIMRSPIPPLFHGVPVIGIVGFVFAGLLAIILLVSILRKGTF